MNILIRLYHAIYLFANIKEKSIISLLCLLPPPSYTLRLHISFSQIAYKRHQLSTHQIWVHHAALPIDENVA